MKTKAISFSFLIGLAACSGGGGGAVAPVAKAPNADPVPEPEPTIAAAARLASSNDTAFRGRLSEDAETITVRVDGNKEILEVIDTPGFGPVQFAFSGEGSTDTFAGIAENAATRVGFHVTTDVNDPDVHDSRIFAERKTDTTLPMSGKADFDGSYSGIVEGQLLITGDASLRANFNTNTIRGDITNRHFIDSNGDPVAVIDASDLRLKAASIDGDGAFAGATGQGNIEAYGTTVTLENGSYQGLITGQNGGQLGGGIINEYDANGMTWNEVGVFMAK